MIVSVADGPVPVALLALTLTIVEPTVVGVPLIRPAALTVRPAGSAPTLKLVALLLPVSWKVIAAFCVTEVEAALVIEETEPTVTVSVAGALVPL